MWQKGNQLLKQRWPTAKNHWSFQGLGEQQRPQQETLGSCQSTRIRQVAIRGGMGSFPLEGRCWALEEWEWHGLCLLELADSHLFRNNSWKSCEPETEPGMGCDRLRDTSSLLPSEIPCTGVPFSICHPGSHLTLLPVTMCALEIKQQLALLHDCKSSVLKSLKYLVKNQFSCACQIILTTNKKYKMGNWLELLLQL